MAVNPRMAWPVTRDRRAEILYSAEASGTCDIYFGA
jgi:hypothetical protein